MRTYSRELRKARRWLASGRSTRVIRFLEPKVPLFLEDPEYYALLGRACIYSGLLKDADTYLNRGLQADPGHLDVRLALAVNHLKRKDPPSAVRTWLEILEDEPSQKQARRGLNALKRISDQGSQDRFLEKFDADRFLPRLSSRWPGRILALLILVLAVLTGLYFREPLAGFADEAFNSAPQRPGTEDLLPGRGDVLTVDDVTARHILTDGEVNRILKNAMGHFQNYEDNRARYELNRIRYSNASEEIRDKAILLLESLGEADIDTLETDFTYEEVLAEPWNYEGCLVLWRGRTANVEFGEEVIRFDFLVGFEEGTVLKGRVPVEVPFLAVMEPLPLELLARVVPDDEGFTLVARTLHFIR